MSGFPQKFYHAVFWPIRIIMGFTHPVVHVRGLENIPDGPAVICCNHSSFSDAIWVIICSHQKRIFRTMAKKELFSHRVLGWFITKLGAFPVDREANDINAVKTALGVLRDGDKLLIFPEGTRVREGDISHPHVGAVTFACRTGAPIVPVFLTRKKRFWAPLTLVFGEAYHPQFEGRRPNSEELEHLTQEMMDKCYALGGMQCPSA